MTTRLHTVAETKPYLDDCDFAGLEDIERANIVDFMAKEPLAGDLIKDSGGARKVRIARQGQGKSAGYRVIVAYVSDQAPVYLLALYAKNERANLSAADLAAVKKRIGVLKSHWKGRKK
jgi:hypothetical protein